MKPIPLGIYRQYKGNKYEVIVAPGLMLICLEKQAVGGSVDG